MNLSAMFVHHICNVWSRQPVLEARLELSLNELSVAQSRELYERLQAWLPSPGIPSPSDDDEVQPDGWPKQLAKTVLEVAVVLQAHSYRHRPFRQVESTDNPHEFVLILEYDEPSLVKACLATAQDLCMAAITNNSIDVPREVQRLREVAEAVCPGQTTGPLLALAHERGIPTRRLDNESLLQLGHGNQQRRIKASASDGTSMIAEGISLDKERTKSLLRELGVPVPDGRAVVDAEDAWQAACDLGGPIVVKPLDGDYGHGVTVNLTEQAQIKAAFAEARAHRENVIVEGFASGDNHRITVVGNRMAAAVRRMAAYVVGDGKHTVAQLIEEANRDPRRSEDERAPLQKICLEKDTLTLLADQQLNLESVLAAGVKLSLSRRAHLWAGAHIEDVTGEIHPETAAQCVRAARVLGLEIAGLDIIAEDIRRPLAEQRGVVLEANAGPAISVHFAPFCNPPQPVCEFIIDHLFPNGATGHIPTVLVVGSNDQSDLGNAVALLLAEHCGCIGRASSTGLYIGGTRIKTENCANIDGANAIFLSPQIEVAILERHFATIRAEGLGLTVCDVLILGSHVDSLDGERQTARIVDLLTGTVSGTIILDHEGAAAKAADALRGAFIR